MVKRKIIISEHDNIAALMEDGRAVEFIIHRGDMLLGDVYLATVENILPSIDAAFVHVGGDKMGFLHSSDVPGKGDLKDRLEPKQQLVVQIMKEPTGHKGPRVSTNVSLPGRFLVMMPESKGISISRKIMDPAERARLKSVVSLMKPPGVGVIIRTEATNQKDSDVTEDFETLLERWQNIVSMADTAKPPTLLYRDQDLLYRVIREAVTDDVQEIVVDSTFGQQRAQQLLQTWNMEKDVRVTLFQGSQPILVGTGVDKEIKLALQTKVPLPSGGYLYIQTTEALSVIDVNSGKFTSLQSQAETIKQTNLEACKEIARQLRLRNIGGMIIVDFIDMESRSHKLTVLQSFENELAPDKSKPQIGQLSDLGLVELTRHRQGQALGEIFTKRCKTCHGTGHEIELFSWMRNAGGSEGERPGRHSRSKLPIRQAGRLQPLPKPNVSLSQKKQNGVLANKGRISPASNVNADNILLSSLPSSASPVQKTLPHMLVATESTLAEHCNNKSEKSLGAKFALSLKLAWLPTGVNATLTRINPKANDIVSLVHSIESQDDSSLYRVNQQEEDDDDDDSDLADSEMEDIEPFHPGAVSKPAFNSLGNKKEQAVETTRTAPIHVRERYQPSLPVPAGSIVQPLLPVSPNEKTDRMIANSSSPLPDHQELGTTSPESMPETGLDTGMDQRSSEHLPEENQDVKQGLFPEEMVVKEKEVLPPGLLHDEEESSLPAPKRRKTRSRLSKKVITKRT